MTKIIQIRKRNIVLTFLAVLGIAFLAIEWNGIPQKFLGKEKETAPAATLAAESKMERQPAQKNGETTETTANVVKMPGEVALSGDKGANFFVEYRLDRQRARGQRLELLREIINNPASEKEARNKAQQEILTISKNISRELELENLIRAKGFDDAIVFLEEDSANVVVKSENVTPEEATRICDLVARGTGIPEQNIIIIPQK